MISSGNISTSNRNDSGLSRKRIVSAAGRMVKEGDKSYTYGYLDKILAVQQDGQQTAAFDYHMDGQLARVVRGDKSEEFSWDGLALIHRGGTNYINEPYVTGGNPILSSKQGVMFNDILGTSLNIGGKAVQMTAFGESSDTNAMFTGKPCIGELGYAFLFRNYRADNGKWQTADPLGYPDGWNNLAYVNNKPCAYYDFVGCVIGDGVWEWELMGPPDDNREKCVDEKYTGGPNPYTIKKEWVHVFSFQVGSAYASEQRTFRKSITVGCEGGFEAPGIGITLSKSTSEDREFSYSTAKGEKAEYSFYQLIETYIFYKGDVVSKVVTNKTAQLARVVKGYRWAE